jgi:hypothetical protein
MQARRLLKSLALALLLAAPAGANAQLTTYYFGGNHHNGNMFNLNTFGSALTITALDINVSQLTGSSVLEVYLRTGGYNGFESTPGAWTLVSSNSIFSANATGTPTNVNVADFGLSPYSLYGMYVTLTGGGDYLEYTEGFSTASNSVLGFSGGTGNGYPFAATFPNRVWNGTIYYHIEPSGTVTPEPVTMALLATGLAGVAAARRRRRTQA